MKKHDLYICCTQADAHWAARLRDSIRGYRLPGSFALPDSALGYRDIYVDASESSFDDELTCLLDDSRCLLIVCTPRARESRPLLERLHYFEQIRNREGVIAVLAEGEPAEAFPSFFIEEKVVPHMLPDGSVEERVETVEPVASDLRGGTPRREKQLLRYETVRIVAALLGVAPDALEQRHAHRARRRMQTLVAVAAAVALIAGGILAWFGVQSIRAGNVARAQEAESMAVASRIVSELPEAFNDDPAALEYVYETIQVAIQSLYQAGSKNLPELDTGDLLAAQPEDGATLLLRKGSLLRLVGDVPGALALYHDAVREYTGDEAFIEGFDAGMARLCTGDYGLGLYLTEAAGGLAAGDIIVALDGRPLPGADLAAMAEDLEQDVVTVQYLPGGEAGLVEHEKVLSVAELLSLTVVSV